MKTNQNILQKIKKCLALSASSNEHEARIALSQARKLMEMHGVSDLDVQAMEVEERRAKAGAKRKPSIWESALACKIADAFGCEVIFAAAFSGTGNWCYIGCGSSPEVAQYSFTVLYRQGLRARAEFIKTRLKRCKAATKTKRADLFSEGWVQVVADTITSFCGTKEQSAAIDAFMSIRYQNLTSLVSRDRNEGRNLRDYEYRDHMAGRDSGRSAQLNRGVGSDTLPLLESAHG